MDFTVGHTYCIYKDIEFFYFFLSPDQGYANIFLTKLYRFVQHISVFGILHSSMKNIK